MPDSQREARFAADYGELGGMGAENVLWLRTRPGVVGQYLPADGVDLVLAWQELEPEENPGVVDERLTLG